MRNKTAIVTGGAGFIGSHLAEALAKRDYHVVIVDDLSTGKRENIAGISNEDNVEFSQGSITDLPLLQGLLNGVDYVFHQTAIPSVPKSVENPLASHEANITGTLNVLLAARDNRVKKVIYASSSSVYGDTPTLPKNEDMLPNPQSPYAVTKLVGEYYCQVFQEIYGLATVCLRYFNVYGPRQDPNSQYAAVIPRFIWRASEGNPPIIFGDGEQTRDFTFVRDVVQANILAVETDVSGILNLGAGENISINELARLVIDITGKGMEPIHQEPRPGDIRHSLADVSKAREIGYNARYSLQAEGLREAIKELS